MNGFRTRIFGRLQDAVHIQVAFYSRRRSDVHGFIRRLHVQPHPIGLRIHTHGRNPQFTTATCDTHGDLSPVGDQYFFEHLSILSLSIDIAGCHCEPPQEAKQPHPASLVVIARSEATKQPYCASL